MSSFSRVISSPFLDSFIFSYLLKGKSVHRFEFQSAAIRPFVLHDESIEYFLSECTHLPLSLVIFFQPCSFGYLVSYRLSFFFLSFFVTFFPREFFFFLKYHQHVILHTCNNCIHIRVIVLVIVCISLIICNHFFNGRFLHCNLYARLFHNLYRQLDAFLRSWFLKLPQSTLKALQRFRN